MLFPTVTFTIFFLLFLAIWSQCEGSVSTREWLLATGTAIFYGAASLPMLAYLAAWTGVLWVGGRMTRSDGSARGSVLLFSAVALGALQLAFWKGFELISRSDLPGFASHWAAPLGVSFFTFQGLTYLFQRHKGELSQAWSPVRLFAFCGFFPTVVSGPIVRAKDWLTQLETPSKPDLNVALSQLALGLTYKLVFSTLLGGFTDSLYSEPGQQAASSLALGLYAYSLQLYCDFCGYSLMASAVAGLMGFRIPDNFNRPYASKSVAEFWRRWHMSFSSWLKDYVYIDWLGGNRNGHVRQVLNVMTTFLLCGAWHGFALHYLIWGAWQAVAVAYSSVVRFKVPAWLSRILAMHIVALGWVWFRAGSASDALDYLNTLWTGQWRWDQDYVFVLVWLALAGLSHLFEFQILALLANAGRALRFVPAQALYWAAVVILTLLASPPGLPPFIYASY